MISSIRNAFVAPQCFVPPAGQPANSGANADMTNPLVKALIQQRVNNFMRMSNPTPCVPPATPNAFQSIDITPRGLMGVEINAFNVNGELMICERAPGRTDVPATWYDLGQVPNHNFM